MKFDLAHISNTIKDLVKENKYLPSILAVSVTATITVGLILYFRRKNRIVRYAKKFLGQEELLNNMGFVNEEFEKMLNKYGDYNTGQQWCMSFAKAVWLKKFGLRYRDKLDELMTPSTQTTWSNFENDKSGKFKTSQEPSKGAIVIWQQYENGSPQWKGHAGIVQDFNKENFETIEGNTNAVNGIDSVSEMVRNYNWNLNNGLRLKGFISIN